MGRSKWLLVLACSIGISCSPGLAQDDSGNENVAPADEQATAPATRSGRKRARFVQQMKNRRQTRIQSQGAQKRVYDPNVPDISDQPPKTLPIPFDDTTTSGKALNLILNHKLEDAKSMLTDAYNEGKKSGKQDPEITYFIAAIEAHTDRFEQAMKYLKETQTLWEKGNVDLRSKILLTKRIADCQYKDRNYKEALGNYKAAMFLAEKQQSVPDELNNEMLESLVGCETRMKDYAAAEKDCKKLIEATKASVNGGGLPAVLSYSWSLVQLSEILRRAGKIEEYRAAQKDWQSLMAQLVQWRAMIEASGMIPQYEQLNNLFRVAYVQALSPKTPAEIAWAGNDFRIKTLPILTWRPKGTPQAAILCIHGLGLENRSFTHTAKRLVERGYMVAAIDVRGFGAWCQTRGEEDLDYDQCLEDIADAVRMCKQKNPGVPIYILGESMGGAIALRAAAKLGSEIWGVISSVPSAERFQQKKMSLQTAMHFVIDPKKPFDVGDYVAERATSEDDVKDAWARDPKARLELSPVELIKFAAFMRTTKRHAEQIKTTPVLVLQGLKDRLVKPKGTFDLFDAVNSEDKSLIVLGLSEHLMFENPTPDENVLDTVDSWVRKHNQPQNQPQPAVEASGAEQK